MAKAHRSKGLDELFRALADATRLRLLNLIARQEVCVCFFVEVLGEGQPKISRHLAYLRKAGLVEARRDGKWMHYRLQMPEDAHAASILRSTLEAIGEQPQYQRDQQKLDRACCGPQSLVKIIGAPLPTPTG